MTTELHHVSDGVVFWSFYDVAVKCECGSCALLHEEGWVVFDPVPLAKSRWEELLAIAPVQGLFLTSANHQRDSLALKSSFQFPIYAPAAARSEILADLWLEDGDSACGMRATALPGAALGEMAYHDGRHLVIGDALIHFDDVMLLPSKYCEDPNVLEESIKKLHALAYSTVFFAHGSPHQGHLGKDLESSQ